MCRPGEQSMTSLVMYVRRGFSTLVLLIAAGASVASAQAGPSDDLVVDLGPAQGLWVRDGDTAVWSNIHPTSAKNIATGDLDGNGTDEVIVDFGRSFGIWVWANKSNWFQIHNLTANRLI